MIDIFLHAFVVYFVVIDPIGNAPIFLAVTEGSTPQLKRKIALQGVAIASTVLILFALFGNWLLSYLSISFSSFKISGGIILLLVALDMVTARRQKRKEKGAEELQNQDQVAIVPLAMPLLAGPAAITSVMVVAGNNHDATSLAISYGALVVVMLVTLVILILAAYMDTFINKKLSHIFSCVIGVILAALSIQFILDGIKNSGLF